MNVLRLLLLVVIALALPTACSLPGRSSAPKLPGVEDLPGVRNLLEKLPGFDEELLRELGLPDLSDIANLPKVGDLPGLAVGENAIALAGPTEMRINVGQRIRGTDIELAGVVDGQAEFLFSGLRAERIAGDSLDYDGSWPNVGGVSYMLRLRVYLVTDSYVRAAGVHRLVIDGIQPSHQPSLVVSRDAVKIPYTGSARPGALFKGTTYGYVGPGEQGAEISGIASGSFPFRKTGDSLRWQGMLRSDLPASFNLRIVRYGEDSVQVAGIANLQLPGE